MSARAPDPASEPQAQSAKNALRRQLLARRRTRLPEADETTGRCAALLAIPQIAAARVVAAYVALPGEPDIGPALDALRTRGVQVLLPVVLESRDLDFRLANGRLIAGPLGVAVPPRDAPVVALTQADVVLVPAVAVDRRGRRLGRGGGSYDRALSLVRPDALVIAVVHADELVEEVPTERHDRRVGAILAGNRLLRAATR